jgi:hypothetical protein
MQDFEMGMGINVQIVEAFAVLLQLSATLAPCSSDFEADLQSVNE